jgi:multicomponent Na+:H+ antiporter subunit D
MDGWRSWFCGKLSSWGPPLTPDQLIALSILSPAVGALAIALIGRNNDAGYNPRDIVTVIATLITFGFVVKLAGPVVAGDRPELSLFEVLPGLAIAFKIEPLGMLFALVASGLWIPTSIYSFGYMRGHHERHQTRFFVCFAIAISAALGIAFARNLLTLFLFYELLTFSTYPLVTHAGSGKAVKAGRSYLGILIFTSVSFLLLAIVWTWQTTGTLEFRPGGIVSGHFEGSRAILLLALFVFGTGKAALMPFHRWLPAAMVAPTPVSALLHAVAVVKAGVFTVLKIIVYVFGIEFLTDGNYALWLCYVAGFTLIAASLVALTKDNLKARLAYSTISQLSYIVLGAALATKTSIVGGGMHIVMHAAGKITLFFCAGAIMVASHKTEISDMKGIGRQMPFTMFAFFIASLSIIGLPPLGGAWSKWYLILGALDAQQFLMVGVLIVSSLLNIAYLLPIVVNAFFFPTTEVEIGDGIKEAPIACVASLLVTAFSCLILFLYPDFFLNLAQMIGEF